MGRCEKVGRVEVQFEVNEEEGASEREREAAQKKWEREGGSVNLWIIVKSVCRPVCKKEKRFLSYF